MHIKNYLTAFSAIMLVLLTQPACHHKKDKGDASSPRQTAIADPLLMLTPDQVEMPALRPGKWKPMKWAAPSSAAAGSKSPLKALPT